VETQEFIDSINSKYEERHREFEMQFWGTKMALAGEQYSVDKLTETKGAMEGFLGDEEKLNRTRKLLRDKEGTLTEEQDKVLKMFERVFGCYIMESHTAREMRAQATQIEGTLEGNRNTLKLGATIPNKQLDAHAHADANAKDVFVEMSSVGLRNTIRVDPDEAVRKACFQGLGMVGDYALDNGFLQLISARNKMARELGYEDYYDYKVTQAEGFGKTQLFKILDSLEADTRPLLEAARDKFAHSKGGQSALQPWNLSFLMAGDVTTKLDPYFPFEKAVEQWGRSFSKMNISYRGATMDLDLLDRPKKYSNGFCHWPQPAWIKPDGQFQPAITHFTSLADPAAIGSGLTGLNTLMHEAGHAAHFANVVQPSPLFAQERAPTSVAYAELQSMFLDSLVNDADWRARYARNREKEPCPWDIIREDLQQTHPYRVFALRGMIAVPYFEKALYELPEEQLTAAHVTALADKVERDIQGGLSPRPLLSVPHILSDESSCYYHGYVLAEMAVHQTREHFLQKYGSLTDNPHIGPELSKGMWEPGNSEAFLDLVEQLTGKPLSSDAWVASLRQPLDELLVEERQSYDDALRSYAADIKDGDDVIDLDMRIRLVDGDTVLADTNIDGSFLASCKRFETYVRNRYAKDSDNK